jgi:phytol kinase
MIDYILTRWTFPSIGEWLIVLPAGTAVGALCGWLVGRAKVRWRIPVGYSRKIFHFVIFSLAGLTGLAGGFTATQVFGASLAIVVFYALWRGERSYLFRAVARPSDAPHQKYYILVPFLMTALGGVMGNILFGRAALIGYITTGWGDAVGEPVGTRWGRHRYPVPTLTGIRVTRSLEGSLGVFLASLLGTIAVLSLGFDLSTAETLTTAFVAAVVTTVVEALTFHSLDNLTIQLLSTAAAVYTVKYLGAAL